MMTPLSIWYPVMPPSSNRLYFKGTRLTEEARAYKEQFKMYVQQNYGALLAQLPEPNHMVTDAQGMPKAVSTKDPNMVFVLRLVFYLNCLNETWNRMDLPKSRRSTFRFKKVDLSNRVKLLEDCFRDAVGIDDALTFESTQRKVHSPDKEGVWLYYEQSHVSYYGIPEVTMS